MSSYTENLINKIIEASDGKDWDSAVSEWVIEDCIEDEDHSSCCICGKEELRFLYTIRNQYNGKELFPIGSRCIRKFGRGDMDEDTSLYELLFKLLHALRDRKRIELTRDYFSRRLLRHLYDQDAFKPTEYNDNDGYNDYEFMLNMFNRRSPMTEKQRRKVNAIIYFSIKPHLENVLANKTKKVQECPQKS